MSAIELALFDLAGTLVRDDRATLRVYRGLLDAAGLEADDAFLTARMGRAKAEVFAEILGARPDDPRVAALVRRFDDALLDSWAVAAPEPLPRAAATLAALRAEGVRIGWTSGFSSRCVAALLARLGWSFDGGAGSDEVAHGRPAPDLVQLAMRRAGVADARRVAAIGDTPNDLRAGTAAGCGLVIGLGHGTHALSALAAHPHTHLLADLEFLVGIVATGPCAGFVVRPAGADDARAIAAAHVRSWRGGCRGIFPDAMLEALSTEDRSADWRRWLADPRNRVLAACDAGGAVLGWASYGRSRDADAAPETGEVYGLYVDPPAWRRGVGRALWTVAIAEMRAAGLDRPHVWVLEENAGARRFYERMGAHLEPGRTKTFVRDGLSRPECSYRLPAR